VAPPPSLRRINERSFVRLLSLLLLLLLLFWAALLAVVVVVVVVVVDVDDAGVVDVVDGVAVAVACAW
jgi:hypothetical protein